MKDDISPPVIASHLVDYLKSQEALYTTQMHPPLAEQLNPASLDLLECMVATHVVGIGDEYALLITPAIPSGIPAWRQASVGLSQLIRQASEAEIRLLFPDCDPQAVPPFGPAYGLPVYASRRLTHAEWLLCPAGCLGGWIRLRREMFEQLAEPVWIDL